MANEEDPFQKFKLAPPPEEKKREPISNEDPFSQFNVKPIYPRGKEAEGPPMPPPNYGRAVASGAMYGAAAVPGQFGDLNVINELPAYGAYGVNAALDYLRDTFKNKDGTPTKTPETERTKEAINKWGEDWQKGAEQLRHFSPANIAYQTMVPRAAKDWLAEKTGVTSLTAPKTEEIAAAVQPYAEKTFGVGPATEFTNPNEKLAKEATSFGTQALSSPGKIVPKVISGVSAGGLGEYLRQNAEGTWYEIPAQIAGNVIGGMTPKALKTTAQTILTPEKLAKERIGQVGQNYNVESTRPVQAMARDANIREVADKIPDRFSDFTRQMTGMKGDLPSIQQLTEDAAQAERRRIFDVVNAKPEARQLDTSQFSHLFELPQFQEAMAKADDIAKRAPHFGIVPPVDGVGGNLPYWHQVKRNLGEAIDVNSRSLDQMSPTVANYLTATKTDLEKALFNAVPDYETAVKTASHTFQSTNAPMAGMEFMRNVNVFDKKDILDAMQKYSPEQRKLFNAGVLQTIEDEIRTKNNGIQSVSRKFLDNPEFNDKLRAAMGNKDYSALRGKVLSENMVQQAAKFAEKHGIAEQKANLPVGKIGAITTAVGTTMYDFQNLMALAQAANIPATGLGLGALGAGSAWIGNKARTAGEKRVAGRMIKLIEKNDLNSYREMDELSRKHPEIYSAFIAPGTVTQAESQMDREGRATGGKVGGSIAQRLVAAAEKAHKYHQKTTEEILDAPDETVVKALAVAKKNI